MSHITPFVINTESTPGTYYVLFGDNLHGSAVARSDTDLRYDNVDGRLFSKTLRLEAPDGTSPMQIDSTTMVTNLNSEMLGGYRHSNFIKKHGVYTTTTAANEGWYRVGIIPIGSQFKSTMFKIKAYTATGTTTESIIMVNVAYYSGNYGSQVSSLSANTSHSYNSSTNAENGYVLLCCRVSFDGTSGYLDVYKYKTTAVTIELEPMVESDWEYLTGATTVNPAVGSYKSRQVTLYEGFRASSLGADSASYSTYSLYGVLGTNTLSNTTDKTNLWAYIGNFELAYNSSYLRGRSGNIRVRMQEVSFDGSIPAENLEDFILDIRVGLGYHADANAFNTLIPTYAVYIEGKTILSEEDIAIFVHSTSTSYKYIRIYVKLKSANKVYCINSEQRYGRSFVTSTYAQTTSYCVFSHAGDQTPIASLPSPAQGNVVYGKHLTPNLNAIEAISETSGFLKKTGSGLWALDNSTYSLVGHKHAGEDIDSGTISGNRGVQAGSPTVSFISYHGVSNGVGGTFYGGTDAPYFDTRLNYNGILHAKGINSVDNIVAPGANFAGLVTIEKSVAGDGGWNQAGLIIKNNNSSTGEVAVSYQNYATGSNYWIAGLNQTEVLKFAYGNTFADTYTKVAIDTNGQIWQGNLANKYWHAGNDGISSGLDADLVQGRNSASANTANTVVVRDSSGDFSVRAITNGTFSPGFGGSGGRYDYGINTSNQSTLEVDNIIVRNKLSSYEMLVNQLRATNGGMFVSSIGKVVSATLSSGTVGSLDSIYVLTLDQNVTHGFMVGDLIRAKRWISTGVSFDVKMEVTAVTTTSPATITAKLKEANAYISSVSKFAGMEFVRIGNVSTASRQGSVYLTSDDTTAPYVDIISGVNSHASWGNSSTIKARFGNIGGLTHNGVSIPANTYGLWTDSAYLSGSIVANSGSIAGWTIGTDALYKDVTAGSEGVGMSPATGSSTTVLWAGTTYQYRELTPWETYGPGFKVTDTGQLYAKNAYISGTGQNSVGIGLNVNSSGTGSIAMGASAESTALNAIALGYGASATGINSIAIGIDSAALLEKSMAIGSYAESGAVNGIALGYSASATQLNSIAIGVNSTASWDSSMAIGTIAESTQLNSIALGYGSSSTGFNSLAIGAISKATWENSVAIGTNSLTFSPDGVAIGSTAKAIGSADIAIGASAMSASSYTSNRKNNIGIGKSALNVISDAEDNIGIGTESGTSLTTGDMNIGIGRDSIKTLTIGSGNIGIGTLALTGVTTGSNNIAIGNGFGEQFFNAADSNKMWLGNNMDETWISGKTTFLKGYQIILADQTQTVKSISVDSGVLEIIGNTNATIRANSVNVGNTSTTQTVIKSVDKEISLPSGAGSILGISNTTGNVNVTATSFNIVNHIMKLGNSTIQSTAGSGVTINYPNAGGTVALVRYADAATALTGSSTAASPGHVLIGNNSGSFTLGKLNAGDGMDFSTVGIGTYTITLGTPSTLSAISSNGKTATSHTHQITTTNSGSSSTIVATDSSGNITATREFIMGTKAKIKYNDTTKSMDFLFL